MELERTGEQDHGRAEFADGEARDQRDTPDGWPGLAVWLTTIAIALCIASSLLDALQIAVEHAEGSVEVITQPVPDETQYRARELLENESDSPIAAYAPPAERRIYDTEEMRRWIGSSSTSAPHIVF